jgi:hypothetical protein
VSCDFFLGKGKKFSYGEFQWKVKRFQEGNLDLVFF